MISSIALGFLSSAHTKKILNRALVGARTLARNSHRDRERWALSRSSRAALEALFNENWP
jgi:hypothetical protein